MLGNGVKAISIEQSTVIIDQIRNIKLLVRLKLDNDPADK